MYPIDICENDSPHQRQRIKIKWGPDVSQKLVAHLVKSMPFNLTTFLGNIVSSLLSLWCLLSAVNLPFA